MTIKIAFFGQKPIAEFVFADLLSAIDGGAPFEISFVCTNVLPTGWWNSANLSDHATERGIHVFDNTAGDQTLVEEYLMASRSDLILSIQHPRILSSSAINNVNGNAFNLHLAPLPRFRGWNGASHAIVEQFNRFGVTLHTMTNRIDLGLIVDSEEFAITDDATAWSLYQDSVKAGVLVMARFFEGVANNGLPSISGVPMAGESRYYKRNALESLRDVSGLTFLDIQRIWRATHFPPYPPAFFQTLNGPVELILKERS